MVWERGILAIYGRGAASSIHCEKNGKSSWFQAKSEKEMYPEVEFKFSDGWFTAFKKRQGISFHLTTNVDA